jgi:hypothetical protein
MHNRLHSRKNDLQHCLLENDHGRYPYIGIVPNTDEGSQGASPVSG